MPSSFVTSLVSLCQIQHRQLSNFQTVIDKEEGYSKVCKPFKTGYARKRYNLLQHTCTGVDGPYGPYLIVLELFSTQPVDGQGDLGLCPPLSERCRERGRLCRKVRFQGGRGGHDTSLQIAQL